MAKEDRWFMGALILMVVMSFAAGWLVGRFF